MNDVARDAGSFILGLVGGLFTGLAFLLIDWDTVIHLSAVGSTGIALTVARSEKRYLTMSVVTLIAAVVAGGTIIEGTVFGNVRMQGTIISLTGVPWPSLLLIVGSTGTGLLLWRLDSEQNRRDND
jgi:hypothetical protein